MELRKNIKEELDKLFESHEKWLASGMDETENFDEDRLNECTAGIHFVTRDELARYQEKEK